MCEQQKKTGSTPGYLGSISRSQHLNLGGKIALDYQLPGTMTTITEHE